MMLETPLGPPIRENPSGKMAGSGFLAVPTTLKGRALMAELTQKLPARISLNIPAAHPKRGLAVAPDVPGQAEPGMKDGVGAVKIGRADFDRGIERVGQLALQAVDLAGLGHHFKAETQVQGEVGTPPEIVLNVKADQGRTHASKDVASRQVSLELPGDPLYERGEVVEAVAASKKLDSAD